MGVREAHDAGGASSQTPESSRSNTTRVRQGTSQTGEPRKETGTGYQEERQERADWGLQNPSKGPGPDEKVCLGASAMWVYIYIYIYLTDLHYCRYVQKFYQMRTQLQAISLRIQVGSSVALSVQSIYESAADRPKQ